MKNKNKILFYLLLGLLILFPTKGFVFAQISDTPAAGGEENVLQLNDQIKAKKQAIDDLKKKSAYYESVIATKETEALSLQNQLSILDVKIQKLEVDIDTTKGEIDQNALETQATEDQINEKNQNIEAQRDALMTLLQTLYKYDNKKPIEIIISNKSFSDLFNELDYLVSIQGKIQKGLNRLQALKDQLELEKSNLNDKKQQLLALKQELEQRKNKLNDETETKKFLLAETRSSEKKFKSLLDQLKSEQEQINTDITSLESKVRKKLTAEGRIGEAGVKFSWPIDPSRGISTYFHDPDYPFRYVYEHPGIDIRTPQRTPIAAPADGYVAIARDAGFGYSYVMLIHDNNFSTVYGHVNKILVQANAYVQKGQTIALSGGLPGTRGAGRLTTGAHLHFEIRINGNPVNPLDYLP